MANKQLVDYIKSQLAAGASRADIQKAVIASGWGAGDTAEALAAAEGRPVPLSGIQQPPVIQPKVQAQPQVQPLPVIHMHPQGGEFLRSPWVWAGIIVVLLIAAGAATYFLTPVGSMISDYFTPAPVVVPEVATTTPPITEQTYSNVQYGFSLQYPLDMQAATSTERLPVGTVFALMPLVGIYESKTLSIQATTSAAVVAKCAVASSSVAINGVAFATSSSSAAAKLTSWNDFHTMHDGACVTLRIDTVATSTVGLSAAQQEAFAAEDNQMGAKIVGILQSFRFVASTAAPASTTVGQ